MRYKKNYWMKFVGYKNDSDLWEIWIKGNEFWLKSLSSSKNYWKLWKRKDRLETMGEYGDISWRKLKDKWIWIKTISICEDVSIIG